MHQLGSRISRRGFLKFGAPSALLLASPKLVFGGAPEMPVRGLCAHRGASGTHPENTLPAFKEAIRLGAHMIEFDVRLTSDGALVLMHDETVDRTTDGRGAVADMTLAQLRRLDAGRFKHPKFAGTSIPTFEETLAMMPRNIWLNCHMKGGAGLGIASARAIMKENRQPQAFLAAETDAAKGARSIESDILICDMERTQKVEEYVNHAISTQAAFIQFVKSYDVPREAIAELKRHHVRVNYYLADSADEVRTLFQAGVDFPLVNDVRAYMPVAWEIGIAPLRPRW